VKRVWLSALLLAPVVLAVAAEHRTIDAGESVRGRPIVAQRQGDDDALVRVLVVGQIHGDEPAGRKVIRALRRLAPPRNVAVWSIQTVNPDGALRGTRQNARGVDLNRNFRRGWRPSPPGTRYYGGPRPFSEPESRAVRRLVRRITPRLTIWYHQPYAFVVRPYGRGVALARRYARLAGMRLRQLPRYPGTATGWQTHRFPDSDAFVVELAAGSLSARRARRHAEVVLRVARGLRRP